MVEGRICEGEDGCNGSTLGRIYDCEEEKSRKERWRVEASNVHDENELDFVEKIGIDRENELRSGEHYRLNYMKE